MKDFCKRWFIFRRKLDPTTWIAFAILWSFCWVHGDCKSWPTLFRLAQTWG